jgi:hypothetical protein
MIADASAEIRKRNLPNRNQHPTVPVVSSEKAGHPTVIVKTLITRNTINSVRDIKLIRTKSSVTIINKRKEERWLEMRGVDENRLHTRH